MPLPGIDPNGGPTVRTNFDGDSKGRAQKIIALHAALESQALNFRARWQEGANYIQPRKGNILTILSPGAPQTILLWDTTAEQALIVFAAGLVSYLTPPNELWARFNPSDKDAPPSLREWFNDSTERVMQELATSTFYETWHEDCLDAGCFGNSLIRCDEHPDDPDNILGFANIPVGRFYWREDNRGRIGTIVRDWKWTAQQAMEEWGLNALGPALKKAAQSTAPAESLREFRFVEVIRPRAKADVRPGSTTAQHRPWECVYVCVEDQNVLSEDGYYENPYAGLRLMRANNEPYGRGPGTQAMPNIKECNRIKQDRAVVRERLARPSWIAPDDTAYTPDNRPDGVTYWDASKGKDYKPEMIQMTNRVQEATDELNEERQMIRDYFFNDMFKLLTTQQNMDREKTAYEVAQMVQERLILFSPIFGRITKEKLTPILYRVFSIMYRNGRLKPLPQGIDPRQIDFEVVYVSKIALAIKAIQNQAFATALQLVEAMMNIDPSVRYLIKTQDGARAVLENAGVPAAWIRSKSEVAALWQKEQNEQQQLQAAQAALAGSQTVKNLGPTAQASATRAISAAAPGMGASSRIAPRAAA